MQHRKGLDRGDRSDARVPKCGGDDSHGDLASPWLRACSSSAEWPDKDEFLDVIYWMRQLLGLVIGIVWGIIPLKGFLGILLFCAINAAIVYVYCTNFQRVNDEDFGGIWELTKEGFMPSFASFLVTWIFIYTALHMGGSGGGPGSADMLR